MPPIVDGVSPSAFKLQHSSPLDTLVRRTSSRRVNAAASSTQTSSHSSPYASNQNLSTPPRGQDSYQQRPPVSPLLHSHFGRSSVATASTGDENSYLGARASTSSSSPGEYSQELEYRYYDDDSIYSENSMATPALRDSWQSSRSSQTVKAGHPEERRNYDRNYDRIDPTPTVVVSSPIPDQSPRAGKAPITGTVPANFSRPVRPPQQSPALPPEDQKRRVLERNTRHPSSTNLSASPSSSQFQSNQSAYPLGRNPSVHKTEGSSASSQRAPSPASRPDPSHIALVPSMYNSNASSLAPGALNQHPSSARSPSPTSVYSDYSFYQLDSATPSPTGNFPPGITGPTVNRARDSRPPQSPLPAPPTNTPSTPQQYLQLGIQHHEANRLKESAICFEKSAKEQGGCGVGMLMWGMTLRHGWGCEKDEKLGFKWLTKAAESAVGDLENARVGGGLDSSAVKVCKAPNFLGNGLDRKSIAVGIGACNL